ncbi:MAG TPA: nucleotidyl transferase AbiEii/AbiGii toxin family protein [Candidatus Babeliales bacterium]|nr:nucleotidyl transferase AbiEii/AbiGii toxin family protein [Candidatus Babeliales bacterium]
MNESALKERLKVIAAEKITTLNKIWKQLLLERFLARLSNSSYQDKFIFKGGLLLAQYLPINRETIDVDFLMTNIQSQMQKIEEVIRNIAVVSSDDGFSFSWYSIEELIQPHMEYAGFRVTLNVQFGKMQDKIQIDIGVGDVVEPVEMTYELFEYKGKPIFAGEITLRVYPPETIFAEKLETVVSKGVINSRMKDYHDLLVMIREPDFLVIDKMRDVIHATFARRGTQMMPSIQFDDSGIQGLQALWSRHLNGLGVFRERLNLPENIREVIGEINDWIESNKLIS